MSASTDSYPIDLTTRMPDGTVLETHAVRPAQVIRHRAKAAAAWRTYRAQRAAFRVGLADDRAPLVTGDIVTLPTDVGPDADPLAVAALHLSRVRAETVVHWQDADGAWHASERLPNGTRVLDGDRFPSARRDARRRAIRALGTATVRRERLAAAVSPDGTPYAETLQGFCDIARRDAGIAKLTAMIADMPDPVKLARQRAKTRDRVRAYRAGTHSGVMSGRVDLGAYSTARIAPPPMPRTRDGIAHPVTDAAGNDITAMLAARRADERAARAATMAESKSGRDMTWNDGPGARRATSVERTDALAIDALAAIR